MILPCATQTAKPGHCRVGCSGGKDSSAVLQLVWLAIRDLPTEHRTKPVHVITTDTLERRRSSAGAHLATVVNGCQMRPRKARRGATSVLPVTAAT